MKGRRSSRQSMRTKRGKPCPFTQAGIKPKEIDYKDVETLERFTTERGKILPRRISGCTAKHQRAVTDAIKKARYMALIPFVAVD